MLRKSCANTHPCCGWQWSLELRVHVLHSWPVFSQGVVDQHVERVVKETRVGRRQLVPTAPAAAAAAAAAATTAATAAVGMQVAAAAAAVRKATRQTLGRCKTTKYVSDE